MSAVVTLYSKTDCHLCDEARAGILGLLEEGLDLRLEEVNIEADPKLLRAYGERIPVCELGGEEVFELTADVSALRARLDTVSR